MKEPRSERRNGKRASAPKSQPILALNAFDAARGEALGGSVDALLARRARTFGPISMLFYDRPLHFVRASGAEMYDAEGTAYLDLYNNVPSVGHAHPHVVEAIARQAALINIHTRYLHDTVLAYAERLLATLPAPIGNIAFTCTGSESNDLALQVARAATGGAGFVVTEAAYHGNTSAVLDISPSSAPGRPAAPHVRFVPPPDPRRCEGEKVGARFAADVRAAIDDLEAHGIRFAALVFDSIFSSDGVFADPPGFLGPAVRVARKAGGLVIADEVQPGFGRTGKHMWGFARHRIAPDMVTMGKPMGNGYPIGAVAASPDLFKAFTERRRLFQHLRRQPCRGGGRHGGPRRAGGREADGERATRRRASGGRAEGARGTARRHRRGARRGPLSRRGHRVGPRRARPGARPPRHQLSPRQARPHRGGGAAWATC